MGFKFNLESVLKHRQRLEEEAQREFAEAQRAVNEILQKIESMYNRMDEVREEIAAAQKSGTAQALEQVRNMEEFLVSFKKQIEATRLQARELMAAAEERQEKLIFAAQEKKVLAKLKERREAEHREHVSRIEAKELDDLTTIRQSWGKR